MDLDPASFADSRLPLTVSAGPHTVRVLAHCRYSRTGEGLHRFVDPADKATYLYTQFEPADARRMFANFEQPDLKAEFAISAIAPQDWTVVSNGTLLSVEPFGDGHARFSFAETKPISTYLTALVAGDYSRVDRTLHTPSGDVPAALYCRRSLADHLDADRIFDITESGFGVFERHFAQPYPFGKYDQVFVPEYNGGAMENVGCVTLRDEYVFRSRATPASYQVRDDTILHELSHMWFGDLVTMRWWDDLWLKESFATWASNFALSQIVDDPETAWASFTNGFKTWAYRQDQLPSTHPIAADMVDLEAVEQNFDGITYSKGASVLVQLVAFVGQEDFLAGCRQYFQRHAYGNTSLGDLLAALHAASGRDLSDWSAQWLETTGVNTLQPEIALDDSGTITSFAVRQSAAPDHPTLRAHRIAVGLYDTAPADVAVGDRQGTLTRVGRIEADIAGERTEIGELVGLKQPDLLLVNDDDLTYAKVRLDPRSLRTVVEPAGVPGECPGSRGLLVGDLGHVPRRRAGRGRLRRAGAVDRGGGVGPGRRTHGARAGRQRGSALHPAGPTRRGAAALAGRGGGADGRGRAGLGSAAGPGQGVPERRRGLPRSGPAGRLADRGRRPRRGRDRSSSCGGRAC